MKKRIVAMLLALIMLLGMLPMSVFAVDADADSNGTGNSVLRSPNETELLQTVNFTCSGGEIIAPATGVKVLNGGTLTGETYNATVDRNLLEAVLSKQNLSNHTLGNYTTSVTYLWNAGKQTWETSDTVSVKLTHPSTEIDPDGIPEPNPADFIIIVRCKTTGSGHKIGGFPVSYVSNGYNVHWKQGDTTCTITLKPQMYADFYSELDNSGHKTHTTKATSLVQAYKYDSVAGWQLKDNDQLYIDTTCGEVTPPTKTYTVTYTDGVGGEFFEKMVFRNLNPGVATPAFGEKDPYHPGYTFVGWDPKVEETVTGDATYTAKWTPVGPTSDDISKATLTYAPNGSNVTNMPESVTQTLELPNKVTVFTLSDKIPERIGYKFLGWATGADATTVPTYTAEKLKAGEKLTLHTGNPTVTLYAIWEESTFLVRYSEKDGNSWKVLHQEHVPVAEATTHPLWMPPVPNGYEFDGWYQDKKDVGQERAKKFTTTTQVKKWEFYCDYTPVEYTITYDYRDKDIADKKLYPKNAEKYTIEQAVTLNPITKNGMFGKTFLEWRCDLDKDGVAEKITEIPAGTTGDLTVKAYWNHPVTYTVYDEAGNEVREYCQTINVPEDDFSANLKPKTVEKDGYEFDGWYQDSKDFGKPNKRTETLSQAKNWKLCGVLKYVEKPVYVYVQPTYKGTPLTKSDAKAVAALERLGFESGGFNKGGKFVTLGKLMTAKTNAADMADEIDDGKLALYSAIDAAKFNEHVLNSIDWDGKNALTFVTNTTHKGYEADGKIDAYHLNGTMSFQSVTFDAGTEDEVNNMPADGYYICGETIDLPTPTRPGYTFAGWDPEVAETVTGNATYTAKWIKLPTAEEIAELGKNIVGVVCANAPDKTKFYGLINGGFTSTEPKVDSATQKYESTITLIPSAYCSQYSTDTQIPHTVNPNQTTNGLSFVVQYDGTTKKWTPKDAVQTMGIWVKCDKHEIPAPTTDTISGLKEEIVAVVCTNVPTGQQSGKFYGLINGGFTSTEPKFDPATQKYESTITLIPSAYCSQYSTDTQIPHTVNPNQTTNGLSFVVQYDGTTKKWTPKDAVQTMGIWVKCDKHEIPAPTTDTISGLKEEIVAVVCTNVPAGQQSGKYYGLIDGGFTSTEPKFDPATQKYESTITLIPSVYCKQYSADTQIPHTVNPKQTTEGLSFTVKYHPETKMWMPVEEVKQMGIWVKCDTFTVTFNSDGGTAVPKQELRHGEKVTEPENPTKTGYTFDGWFAPEAEKLFDFNTTITADITLKAQWKANTYRYEIHYLLQAPDGSYVEKEVDKTPTGVFDTTVTITPDANKYGAHYPYNSVKSVVSGVVTVDDPTTILKLYVYYDLDFHALTFDTMGGSRIAPVKVRHGNAVAKPKDPVNGGYWFDGWYTDKTYRTPYNFATPLTQDTTIYAKWFLIVLPGVTIKKATPKLNTYDHFAYVQGYPDGTVKPAGNITRAETAAILFRLMDNSSRKTYLSTKSGFRDVTAGSWYNTYVATLNNAGVITDSANGYFRPNDAITRAELAAMLASFTETTRAANYFDDVSANHWAANAIAICAKLGWITGYPDGSFRPDRNVTRAELMAMINRATGRAPKSADAFLPGMKTWSDNTADKWYYLDVQEATNSHSYAVSPTELWTALTAAPDWTRYE